MHSSRRAKRDPPQVQTQPKVQRPGVMTPKFKQGDVVRHRASGELGVVVAHSKRCSKHVSEEDRYAHFCGWRPECDLEFGGAYEIDTGFERDTVMVSEYLLELVSSAECKSSEGCGVQDLNTTRRCGTCRWWKPVGKDMIEEYPFGDSGYCMLTGRDSLEIPEHPSSLAICDGYCGLVTNEDFSCNQWEAKE